MGKKNRFFGILSGILLTVFCLGSLWAGPQAELDDEPLASVTRGTRGIQFRPKVISSAMVLSVSKPDGTVFQQTFEGSATPYFEIGGDSVDGSYTYELRSIPGLNRESRGEIAEKKTRFGLQTRGSEEESREQKDNVQTGYFQVRGGRIVTGGDVEPTNTSPDSFTVQDVLHYDDVIITGSLAVGFDSVNGESFGYDTIRLKENNLRLHFMDTSIGTFPTTDWRILINDTTSGGANYFSIQDSTAGWRPFTIEAGAPANSLYVEDYGRVGLGTSVPYVELHIADGDSPTVRLDQDGSSGWTAQRWDLCGNETNFFIRDVTNGSKLCFRIQPNTPSNTLCMRSTGRVGIGTWSPESSLEIEDTGENVILILDRTDGAKTGFSASGDKCAFGTLSNHPLYCVINGVFTMILETNGSLHMSSGAYCTAAGVWVDASSREYKENIEELSAGEAMDALEGLNPVKYNYKKEKDEGYVGFIAEDVPELVASKDKKGMSPMDVVAVLTKVVKEQQKMAEQQKRLVEEQQEIIGQLRDRVSQLEKKLDIKN